MKNMSKAVGAAMLAATLAVVPALPAAAESFSVVGSTYTDNQWANHPTFREKFSTTWANFTGGHIGCTGTIELRLRTSSAMATYSDSWRGLDNKNFYGIVGSHPEDGRLDPGSYAFSSRWGGCGLSEVGRDGTLSW